MIIAIFAVRHFYLKDSNRLWSLVLTRDDFKAITDWLKSGREGPYIDQVGCVYRFATQADNQALAELNFQAFGESAFGASFDQFKMRNSEFMAKHDKCFMLMIDPIEKKSLIGYSCLVPLTETGTRLYMDGGVSDATFPKDLIAAPSETPHAILLFAIHLREQYSFSKSGASRRYSIYFWSCIRLHFKSLYPELYESRTLPPLLVHTSALSLRRRLKRLGFENTHKRSRDGYDIWRNVTHISITCPSSTDTTARSERISEA